MNSLSEETIETTILVDVEDDWTATVTIMPIIRPTKGFWTNLLLKNSVTNLPLQNKILLKVLLVYRQLKFTANKSKWLAHNIKWANKKI